MLVKAGAPVDATIEGLMQHMEEGDIIIDGGNEWYENSERRAKMVAEKGLAYIAMGVSGGEEGARNGTPALTSMRPSLALVGGRSNVFQFLGLFSGCGTQSKPGPVC
jgi:6-phosphogluconate dehydrogenase